MDIETDRKIFQAKINMDLQEIYIISWTNGSVEQAYCAATSMELAQKYLDNHIKTGLILAGNIHMVHLYKTEACIDNSKITKVQ